MGSLLLIAVDHILKCDRLHFFLCFLLDLVKKILKRQLNIDAHAAFRVGVGIQMEQRLFSLYRSVDIQQCDRLEIFCQSGPGM